jgi:hypothetical protein
MWALDRVVVGLRHVCSAPVDSLPRQALTTSGQEAIPRVERSAALPIPRGFPEGRTIAVSGLVALRRRAGIAGA